MGGGGAHAQCCVETFPGANLLSQCEDPTRQICFLDGFRPVGKLRLRAGEGLCWDYPAKKDGNGESRLDLLALLVGRGTSDASSHFQNEGEAGTELGAGQTRAHRVLCSAWGLPGNHPPVSQVRILSPVVSLHEWELRVSCGCFSPSDSYPSGLVGYPCNSENTSSNCFSKAVKVVEAFQMDPSRAGG